MEKTESKERDKGKYDMVRIWPLLQHFESRRGQWKDWSGGRNVNANYDADGRFYLQKKKKIVKMSWKNVISTYRETLPHSGPTYWDSWTVKMIFLFELLRKKGKQEKRSIRWHLDISIVISLNWEMTLMRKY